MNGLQTTHTQPRLLIAGTGSGCGKTTVTSALLRAFARRGVDLRAFKCGPDYIDPMFHAAVLGIPSRNLDLFFVGEDECRAQLARTIPEDGCGIIEGVMGFYDGVSGNTDKASAAHLARATDTPAVLIANPKGQSLSLAATLHGFAHFAPNTLRGVILNGVSKGMYPFYKEIAEKSGLRVYGYLPHTPEAEIPDRHLGLVTAGEIGDLQRRLDLLADAAEECLDLDGLLALAQTAPPLADNVARVAPIAAVRIAVARDRAFCFYYEDNLDMLRALGAELTHFSPLEDTRLPDGIDGLYLGGGYPELYAERLSENRTLREDLRTCIRGGLPTIAECGGFMYLHEHIAYESAHYAQVGIIPGATHMTNKLQNFGYITLTAQQDGLLCRAGEHTRAHEFHYAASANAGNAFLAEKPNGKAWSCAHMTDSLYAGYPHLYLGSNPRFAERFVRKCAEYKGNKG